MVAMAGWLTRARVRASRRKRSTISGSRARSGRTALTATSRSSASSTARYTAPMPPWPIFSTIRYVLPTTLPINLTLLDCAAEPS
jgi:hypothetical protein